MTDPQLVGRDDLDDVLEVEQGFATVPEWLLRANIPDRAKTLYAVIQRFGNTSGHRMPSQAELGRWLHCSPDTVDRAAKALEKLGALRVERSPAVRRGQTGVTRAPNRYFLRTTDPSITHVIPSRGTRKNAATPTRKTAATVPAEMRHHREGSKPPPPAPSVSPDSRPGSLKAAVADISTEALGAFGGLDGLHELVAQLRSTRREHGLPDTPWRGVHVGRAITAAITAGYEPRKIPDALLALAVDPETRSPLRLPHDGPWWDIRDLERHTQARRESERARAAAQRQHDQQRRAAEARLAETCSLCRGTGTRTTTVTILGVDRQVHAACDHQETA